MRPTIGEIISRIRGMIKATTQDAFKTDRYFYSIITKHANALMKREDATNKLMRFNSIFETLDLVELIEVDKVEAQCSGIKSGCTFMRTKDKLPIFMQGYWGPLVRTVSSLDGDIECHPTNPSKFKSLAESKNFKYNTTKYFWFLNDYMYFPNLEWDAVRIEGVFNDDISKWKCDESLECLPRQQQSFNVPSYLFPELEMAVMRDLTPALSIPSDTTNDKQSILQ